MVRSEPARPWWDFGVARLSRALESTELDERLSALAQLAMRDDELAAQLLLLHADRLTESSPGLEWLWLVRALEPHGRHKGVAEALGRVSERLAAGLGPAQAAERLALDEARHSLASQPGEAATAELLAGLSAEGALGQSTVEALLATHRLSVARLLEPRTTRSHGWAELLARLGARQAIPALEQWLLATRGPERLSALEALSALADPELPALLTHWRDHASEPALAKRAAELLRPQPATVTRDLSGWCPDERALAELPLTTLESLPSLALAARASDESNQAPWAAFCLAKRDKGGFRGLLQALLSAPHPLMRGAVALGYADSAEPSLLLTRALERELDPRVRRALVRALSHRDDPFTRRSLQRVARLDPDGMTRNLARAALAGKQASCHLGALLAGPAPAELDAELRGPITSWASSALEAHLPGARCSDEPHRALSQDSL